VKNKSIGSLILLALLAPNCGGGKGISIPDLPARWSSQYRTPTTVNLRAVKFDSAGLKGIVAGEAGTFVRTDNGGLNWTQVEYAPANRGGDILAMGTVSTTVVAVGADSATGGSAAFTSTDAINWFNTEDTVYPRFPLEPWVDVAVIVPAGPISSPWSYRLRPSGKVDLYDGTDPPTTKDSTVSQSPTPNATWTNGANGIAFFGISGYGLVCGGTGGFGQIRGTVTNGDTWDTRSILDALNNPITCPPLRRFSMLTNFRGYVCGDGGTVLGTADTNNWYPVPNKPGWATADLRGISFMFDGLTGWVVGLGGAIYKVSSDGVTWTWQSQVSGTLEDLYDVCFVDINTGYAVGNNGTVLKTTDGGSTPWVVISGPTPPPWQRFNAVDFTPDGITGLAVGDAGKVYRTTNSGLSWTLFNTGVPVQDLLGVAIARGGAGNLAAICGKAGTIRYNSDYKLAGTWTAPAPAPPVVDYNSILFPLGDLNGVCVGASGTVLKTIDGGQTWGAPGSGPSPAAATYRTLCSNPAGTMVFAGGDGGIVNSSDISGLAGADTWNNAPTLTGIQINTLQAPSGTTWSLFAGGANGKAYRLDAAMTAWDGGTTVIAGTTTSISGLAFTTDLLGWAVVQDTASGGKIGGVFTTINGGNTWLRSYLHVKVSDTNRLRAIWMDLTQTGAVVGDGGMILYTTTGGQ
jgi:photosystem II stability/assembly factor-like uncharacterized protein